MPKQGKGEIMMDDNEIITECGIRYYEILEEFDRNSTFFLRKWREAKKEIPATKMDKVPKYLIGAMAGYVPPKMSELIISRVIQVMKED